MIGETEAVFTHHVSRPCLVRLEALAIGTLFVVATPIGNLEDVTLRALRILREVNLIAAEDTRTTRKLLTHYDIHTPLTSFHDFSGREKRQHLMDILSNQDVALVSEAGMPGISDPGFDLIRDAIAMGIAVVPIPGPSALIAALAVSGLPTDKFLYLGFLPRRAKERRTLFQSVAHLPVTLVAFEAPHRLLDSLSDALTVLGNRPVAVARELTKLYEEIWRGTLSGAIAHFEATGPRGEFTLVIGGAEEKPSVWNVEQVQSALAEQRAAGVPGREAAKIVAQRSGWSPRAVYQIWVEMSNESPGST